MRMYMYMYMYRYCNEVYNHVHVANTRMHVHVPLL